MVSASSYPFILSVIYTGTGTKRGFQPSASKSAGEAAKTEDWGTEI